MELLLFLPIRSTGLLLCLLHVSMTEEQGRHECRQLGGQTGHSCEAKYILSSSKFDKDQTKNKVHESSKF